MNKDYIRQRVFSVFVELVKELTDGKGEKEQKKIDVYAAELIRWYSNILSNHGVATFRISHDIN